MTNFGLTFFDKRTEHIDDPSERNFEKLINEYLFLLFIIFLIYSSIIVFYYHKILTAVPIIFLLILWGILFFLKDKRKKKKLIFSIFLVLVLVIFYFHVFTFKNAGLEYLFFSVLFATSFFFDVKKDTKLIFLIVTLIAILMFISSVFDLKIMPKSKILKEKDFEILKIINLCFSLFTFTIDLYFISSKEKEINNLKRENIKNIDLIENLLQENKELYNKQVTLLNLTEENLIEIYHLAEENSPFFLEKFDFYFKGFISNLKKISNTLVESELHMCALMRLNFETKKIAQITNSSVRAVESRKYRIRKKLNIPAGANINNFILKIEG